MLLYTSPEDTGTQESVVSIGLNENGLYRLICLIAWRNYLKRIRGCDPVGGGVSLGVWLQETPAIFKLTFFASRLWLEV